MAPDINSLPPSRSSSTSRILSNVNGATQPPASPPSPSTYTPHSLAATAVFNAGARGTERRRSSARMNFNSDDAAAGGASLADGGHSPLPRPSPGFEGPRQGRMADRERAPSLGELHQELESEQEGQVNRLLFMIRQQQAQIQALTLSQNAANQSALTSQGQAIEDSTPTSERSMSLSHPPPQASAAPSTTTASVPRSRSPFHGAHRSELSRTSSYRSSRNVSPLIRPMSGHDGGTGEFSLGQSPSQRDDISFYMAETQSLGRENAMLRIRIRELERQLAEPGPEPPAPNTVRVDADADAGVRSATSTVDDEDKDED